MSNFTFKDGAKLKSVKGNTPVTVIKSLIDHNGNERVLTKGTGEQNCWFTPSALSK